ncbi:FAD-dependent oxidoreductase [Psychrobium sp. 1_MG-2023]|uniref:FAD-dependent oxidoreductase n=1 Tax=Psychrobium sp. 1_MG-2023 TaxID=3062624 RepID=UPI000C336BEC|nr:bifunctional TVP38/TMEM64 family protein/FAD-dependent oxidoreductase [Psychrobium sp. 1_MG-2023]MDP2561452.1 FAD-dependent oxidoreductase [Psychrobium sp. 1_MG-2023]PKF57719.1 pyridine nucleotide-disulfide oxidoreductase [Alteromonadales bacterium alter-6D02]
MNKSKIGLIATFSLLVVLFFTFNGPQYISLNFVQSNYQWLGQQLQNQPILFSVIFFISYIVITGLSLPGAALLTLLAGSLFGIYWGVFFVSFASTIGATIAFLGSRFIFRDYLERKFMRQLAVINQGMKKQGSYYLLSLRLIPLFPFFIVNLTMGLTQLSIKRYFIISQLGMLPGTVLYVFAGTQLAQLESLSGLISPSILLTLTLIGLFPLIVKSILNRVEQRKRYRQFKKPETFDRNLIVIGAGAGGLVSAYIASAVKAKVTLIEKHAMGGDCLNTGCVPSKALIRAAKFAHDVKESSNLGFEDSVATVNFAKVMTKVHQAIKAIEPHDSVDRYTKLGVEVLQGEAKLIDPWTVEINNQRLTANNVIIATGARPAIPSIEGLDLVNYLTSENLWQLTQCPKRLLVLGGGPIGCELSQAFARLGSQVTLIQRNLFLMPKEDKEVSEYIKQQFINEGITVLNEHQSYKITKTAQGYLMHCTTPTGDVTVPFDSLLIALGRSANTTGFGLEQLGVELRSNRTIAVNDYLQTNYPNIYAVGDVTGPYQFTHVAAHQAWYSAVNSLFGSIKSFKVDYRVIPWATFTDPEIARVGINKLEANAQGIAIEATRYEISELDRAITDNNAKGWIEVLTPPKSDKILGVTIVATHAGEIIAEYVSAMKHNIGLNKLLGTIHIYPTMSEANKYVAGNWKKNNSPVKLYPWLEKFHRWQRKDKKS